MKYSVGLSCFSSHLDSLRISHPQSVRTAHEPEDPNSSQISLCSSLGNTIDSGAQSYQEYRGGELVMHYGQPHAYALYDFETKVEGDLQFRVSGLINTLILQIFANLPVPTNLRPCQVEHMPCAFKDEQSSAK